MFKNVENVVSIAIASKDQNFKGYSYRSSDQQYLVEKIRRDPNFVSLLPGAITWCNNKFGEAVVTEALRCLAGAMPGGAIDHPLAYLAAICERVEHAQA